MPNTVQLQVPRRSGFDKSHHNLLTTKVGTITPILVDEVIPNTKVNLRLAISASLPPLASDTFMKVDLKVEAFFVPMRLLWSHFEEFYTNENLNLVKSSQTVVGGDWVTANVPHVPMFRYDMMNLTDRDATSYHFDHDVVGPGTLADYLGVRGQYPRPTASGSTKTFRFSALPFLAYHRLYEDWYRSPLVNKSIYGDGGYNSNQSPENFWPAFLGKGTWDYGSQGYTSDYRVYDGSNTLSWFNQSFFADAHNIMDLRQRNFGFDYFTMATPSPELGGASSVSVSGSTFTIAALRAANSLQQFKERNNIAGTRFVDVLSARYGASLSDGVAQRSIHLGSASYPIYSRGVSVTGDNTNANNPFAGAAGGEVARAQASGVDTLISGFVANEPGYIFVNATIVPKVTYASGVRRYLWHTAIGDFANPILQAVGPQTISDLELYAANGWSTNPMTPGLTDFGYVDRFAEYMTYEDECHGLITEGESLASFAAQRAWSGAAPQISADFLRIPTDYLDNVTVVSQTVSDYGAWLDCAFDYKVAQPLAEYSMPTLQDPAYEHGQTVTVHRGGFRF